VLGIVDNQAREPAAVLLVDDHRPTRLALGAVLEPLGRRVAVADSAVAALRLLASERYAVILCDVRMPGMDGFEMLARLRAQGLAKGTANHPAERVAAGAARRFAGPTPWARSTA